MALLSAEQLREPTHVETLEWPRTSRKQPLVIPAAGGTPAIYTRVSTFAGTLDETSNLTKWKQRLTLAGAAATRWITEAAARHDPASPEGKRELNRLAWKAFIAGGGELAQLQGTWLHKLTEHHDLGEDLPPHSAADAADIAAYAKATSVMRMLHIEAPVVLDHYRLAGTTDRIGYTDELTPDGRPGGYVIADVKTGSIDWSALKIAMQLAPYARGRRYDPTRYVAAHASEADITAWRKRAFTREEAEDAYLPTPPINPDWGIVIHLPAGSGECHLHWIDLRIGWEGLEVAARVRSMRGRRGLLVPMGTPPGTPAPIPATVNRNLSRSAIYPVSQFIPKERGDEPPGHRFPRHGLAALRRRRARAHGVVLRLPRPDRRRPRLDV